MLPHVAGSVPSQERMTGAVPTPRHRLLGAEPFRIRGSTPAQFSVIPSQLSMWGNSQYGDCVSAEEAYYKAVASVFAGLPEVFISESVVIAWARQHGVLNGADLLQVIKMQAQSGFSQGGNTYGDVGNPVGVDYTNQDVLFNAISQGGAVKIGVAANQLQGSVGSKNGSFLTGFRRDNNEDHCVALSGFGTFDYLAKSLGVSVPSNLNPSTVGCHLYTWDTINIIDFPSMMNITGEAWLRAGMTVNGKPVGPIPPVPVPVPVPTPTPDPTPLPVGVTEADVLAGFASALSTWEDGLRPIQRALLSSALPGLQATIQSNMDSIFGVSKIEGPAWDWIKGLANTFGDDVYKHKAELLTIALSGANPADMALQILTVLLKG